MGLYSRYIFPRLLDRVCGTEPLMRQRMKVVPLAEGRVLEVGIGSGLNLPYYDTTKVTKLWGLDPSAGLTRIAKKAARSVSFDIEFIDLPSEEIPLEDSSIDTVLITYTLCTIPETEPALRELGRVLKPGGELVFCEHGVAPDEIVRRWQNRINPIWKPLAGGCHLNRAIPNLIEQGGFTIKGMDTMYIPGWRPASYNYWGTATHP